MRLFHPLCLALCALLLVTPAVSRAGEPAEAARLRILLVLDTDDRMGATWGLDGDNVRAVLEAGLKQQRLDGRYTLDALTGAAVSPQNILRYYETLDVTPRDTVLFYYSGHGATHRSKGHYLALTRGPLYRQDLLGRMQKARPRLVVLLTDCCSNLAGGASVGEPAPAVVKPIAGDRKRQPRARVSEPAATEVVLDPQRQRSQEAPRPETGALLADSKASRQEPPGAREQPTTGKFQPIRPRARQEEPPTAGAAPTRSTVLTTASGRVPLGEIVSKTDGVVLRDLLFRSQGVVDVNGCKKGTFSHGTLPWGGSLFTIALLDVQRQPVASLDANGNRVVEWREFFPALQHATSDAARRAGRGKIQQEPEAIQLGQ